MGEVWLGHDTALDRAVAIKFILAASATEALRRRFLVEARAVARLQHPNVVSVYRVGEVDGYPYLVSEFIAGADLHTLPRPVPWQRALSLGLDIARGLAAAHRRGVVHRDIKPANVLLSEDGEVKILDFGVAKLVAPRADEVDEVDEPGFSPFDALPLVGALDRSEGPGAVTRLEHPGEFTDDFDNTGDAIDSNVTHPGTIVGTPAYIAPEIWRGEPATPRADVYSLGALLYELCSGRLPHEATSVPALALRVALEDVVPLAKMVPAIDAGFAAVIDRCLAREPGRRYPSGNEVRVALAQLTPEARAAFVPEGNPYRGLNAFDVEHRGLFFGRDSEIRVILERLTNECFVLVAGDSGVGKSSLCRAGVLPRASAWLDSKRVWTTVALVPGKHPCRAFATALAPYLELPEPELTELLETDANEVLRKLRKCQADRRGIVIFIDQLEELVTLSDPTEAATLAEVLGWLAAGLPGVRVLATVRGDFLSRLASLAGLVDEIARALFFLRPLSAERIREAITGPAAAKGIVFESEALVDELVESTARTEGGLPLLQFALSELWMARDRHTHTITAATLAALGGVGGALSRHADDLLVKMPPPERESARLIMLRLVTADGTRARRTNPELGADNASARAALSSLVDGRLVVAQETPYGAQFEIAHEALLQGWGTLARWLTLDADLRAVRERLLRAAADWERQGGVRDVLWSARQLEEAKGVEVSGITERELRFLNASRRAARRARFVRIGAALALPLALGVTYGGVRLKASHDVGRRVEAMLARVDASLAVARTQHAAELALQQTAFAQFDEPNVTEAEKTWTRVRAAQAELGRTLSGAGQEAEASMALAPERQDVRERVAEVLYERALFADERKAASERDELLDRLALYDASGERRKRWDAPAKVSLSVSPEDATVELVRYRETASGARVAEPLGPAARASSSARALERGSYLAILRGAGTAVVRYPFTVDRGENAHFTIDLPPSERVPATFAYVPPGRFLFGSQEDDSLRRSYYHTVPIHSVSTSAYLIAKHETTFADWIAFLNALPPAVRAEHVPEVKGGFQGALLLKPLDGESWELTLKPAAHSFTVSVGERLVYPGRSIRASQDWLKFPVSGIGAHSAEAYAAWLSSSGRVSGARLCTEIEWQRAARGADDRHYPHGDVLSVDDANFDDTYAKAPLGMGPDEVGAHPSSSSPFGIEDASGNVWEWAVSSLGKGEHAALGGSYYFSANSSRCANREVTEASFRDVSVGLRVCADAR